MKRRASIFIHMIFIFTLVVVLLAAAVVAALPSENKRELTTPASGLNRVESFFSSIAFSYESGVFEFNYDSGSDKPAQSRFNLNPRNFLAQRSFLVNFIALIYFLTMLVWILVESISLSMLTFGFIRSMGMITLKRVEQIILKRQIFSRPIGYQPKHASQKNVFVSS